MKQTSAVRSAARVTLETVEEAKRGTPGAFECIYELYKSRVYALCVRVTKNVPDSEDLTQEVFIQVSRKLHGFRGDSAFGTWLYRVALNIAMMHLRKRGIEAQSLDIIEVEQNSATSVLPTASYVCDPLKYLSLKRAIATLPKGRRTVVILHDIQGLTHREVGLRLGIQAETSKAQLHHAHRTLRSILTSTHPSEANLREDSVLSSIPAHVFEPGGLGEVEFTAAAD